MNQTVEVLSMRIVQLENALCEAQEQQENSDAEKEELNKRSSQMQTHIDGIVLISNAFYVKNTHNYSHIRSGFMNTFISLNN